MPVDRADTRGSAGGRFVERSYTNRFGTRAYKLYIPSGYIGQAVPLIVMLHGCTQSPDDLATGTRMNLLAEEHTFLVAYPAQAAAANSSRCWNWFEAADQQRGRGEPSLIAGITCEVVGEYHVAADRVYVAGMSAGGAMAAIMGATYPDLYAAIGVHSGLAPGAAHDLPSAFSAMRQGQPGTTRHNARTGGSARTLPAILFHGDRDTTVHPRNGDHLLTHHWTANRGTPDSTGGEAPRVTERRGRVSGGYAYTCATYQDANGRAIVERWTVHGLGHAWSGGSLPGSYTDPKGPDASAEMLRFFHEHPLQGEPTGQPIA
jgi:poly(hydroxyalkanoate) depolymerase family esterase